MKTKNELEPEHDQDMERTGFIQTMWARCPSKDKEKLDVMSSKGQLFFFSHHAHYRTALEVSLHVAQEGRQNNIFLPEAY